jgi:hypothetical protein
MTEPNPTDSIRPELVPFYAQIGVVATAFSTLDFLLTKVLQLLVGGRDSLGPSIMLGELRASFDGKRRVVAALGALRLAKRLDLRQQLDGVLKDARRLSEKRNQFVHGSWRFRRTRSGELKAEVWDFTSRMPSSQLRSARVRVSLMRCQGYRLAQLAELAVRTRDACAEMIRLSKEIEQAELLLVPDQAALPPADGTL